MRRICALSVFCALFSALGLFAAMPASAAMIAGSTDAAKAATAARFHDWRRYNDHAAALTPKSQKKDDRVEAADQNRSSKITGRERPRR